MAPSQDQMEILLSHLLSVVLPIGLQITQGFLRHPKINHIILGMRLELHQCLAPVGWQGEILRSVQEETKMKSLETVVGETVVDILLVIMLKNMA